MIQTEDLLCDSLPFSVSKTCEYNANFSTSYQHLLLPVFLRIGILVGIKYYLGVVLVCIFLMAKWHYSFLCAY